VTKPSELAFYPVPKLLIKRVGGHEMYGALRASEIGDGTIEQETAQRARQMLLSLVQEPELLDMMNQAIVANHRAGLYDGARYAVARALEDQSRG